MRLALALVVLAAGALALPAVASAVTCERNAKLLSVELDGNDLIVLSVSNGNVQLRDLTGSVACTGGPTVTNLDAISVFNQPGSTSASVTILEPSDFAPGAAPQDGSDPAGATPEIEIFVNLNNAGFSVLSLRDRGGNMRFGQSGCRRHAWFAKKLKHFPDVPCHRT